MKMLKMLSLLVAALAIWSPATAKPNLIKVDCDKGKTITDALKHAEPGDTFSVSGICRERVTITTDGITLDGQGSAVVDGGGGGPVEFTGVVTVNGARGVTIKGLTVQRGPGEGILGQRGATFTVKDTTVQDNASTGIAVGDGSTAHLTDVTAQRNLGGLDVFTGSVAILRGTVVLQANISVGAAINGLSVLEIRGAHVQANDNGGVGIVAGSGQLAIFGFADSAGSTLTASDNGFAGIVLAASKLTAFPRCKITVANNVIGLFVVSAFATVVDGNAEFVAEGNQIGLSFGQVGGAIFQGGPLTVQNNGVGLLGDGAGTLTISSDPAKPSRIVNNGTDVDLKFGTRATFDGVAIGSITCDQTVLSRGTTVCP
jgi:Right handed beta helix region